MLTPSDKERLPIKLEQLYSKLELDIMKDIVRRMKLNNNEITRSADYQITRLFEMGVPKNEIRQYIQKTLNLSDKELDKIYKEIIDKDYSENKNIYRKTKTQFIPYKDNIELQTTVNALKQQTKNTFDNITQTTGFIRKKNGRTEFRPLTQYYTDTLDRATIEVLSGTKDYNTVLKETVDEMTNSGLRTVDYASGRTYRIENAVRTAVMTGASQVMSQIALEIAKELGTNTFEISWHATARPTHRLWQGRVYTEEELYSVCGLGTGGGLQGPNCKHTFHPFIEGVSERTYTDEELDRMNAQEDIKREFGGKSYTPYEATQEQRKMEREMRKYRQDIVLLQEGGANLEDITAAKARLAITSNRYSKFSKAMGIPQQRERIYDAISGANNTKSNVTRVKIPVDRKAYNEVEKRAKLYYNGDINAYIKDETIRRNIRNNEKYNKIHWGRQEKHIKNSNNYIDNRSYFTISKEEVEEIAMKNKGTGYIYRRRSDDAFNNKEEVFLDRIIGHYINYDKKRNKIIDEYDTNSIVIHYSKKGIHIVPGGRRKE